MDSSFNAASSSAATSQGSAAANAATASATQMARCGSCGNVRQVVPVTYNHNIGMLVLRRTVTLKGFLCKSCVHKHFWEYAWKNVILGPWGFISLIAAPIYLLMNVYAYLVALHKLRGAVE